MMARKAKLVASHRVLRRKCRQTAMEQIAENFRSDDLFGEYAERGAEAHAATLWDESPAGCLCHAIAARLGWAADSSAARPAYPHVPEYIPMTVTEVFVVRIYRRDPVDSDRLNGVVEVVRDGKEHAFGSLAELTKILGDASAASPGHPSRGR